MKKIYILTLCIILNLVVFPVIVFAEENFTYGIINGNECTIVYTKSRYTYYALTTSTVRFCLVNKYNSNETVRGFASTEPFSMRIWERTETSTSTCGTAFQYNSTEYNGYHIIANYNSANINEIESDDFPINEALYNDNIQNVLYYTFGEGAVGPQPTPEPVNWGILKNVSFEQRTRGTGYINYKNNLDYISWDSNLDSNNNDISECQVQIRAKTGLWSATEPDELNRLDMHNFVEDEVVDLGTYNASIGTMSFSWQRVLEGIHGYDSPFMVPIEEQLMNDVWTKVGWYYEVRLVPPDSEPLTWQQVYTPLYSSVKDSQTILNNTYITNDVINTYQNVTQLNNQTQMIVNYNNTETTIVNPEQEPQYDTDSDLYSDILRKILNTLLSIPQSIHNASEDITQSIIGIPQGIAELFVFNANEELPSDQELNELISDKVENTYIGDLVMALGRIKTAFSTYKGTYSTIGQITIPYLGYYWNGEYVTVFTGTTFNLYDVVKTPSGTINVFYETYLSIVDGIIYITLLRMLFKRLIHSLETE